MRQKGWGMLQPSGEHAEKDGHAHVMSESATSGPASSSAMQSDPFRRVWPSLRREPFGCNGATLPPPVRGLRRGFSDLPVDLPVDLAKSTRMWKDNVRLIPIA